MVAGMGVRCSKFDWKGFQMSLGGLNRMAAGNASKES